MPIPIASNQKVNKHPIPVASYQQVNKTSYTRCLISKSKQTSYTRCLKCLYPLPQKHPLPQMHTTRCLKRLVFLNNNFCFAVCLVMLWLWLDGLRVNFAIFLHFVKSCVFLFFDACSANMCTIPIALHGHTVPTSTKKPPFDYTRCLKVYSTEIFSPRP